MLSRPAEPSDLFDENGKPRTFPTGCKAIRHFPGARSRALFMKNFETANLNDIPPTRCPCGWTQRAFAGAGENVASLHLVKIEEDSRTHYHKKMTEIYLVLEGEGQMELDGQLVPLKPMSAVYIRPGCRHRAIGRLKIVNIPIPSFDPTDEWFD
jgi:mannose-6-phosphate isomerase-like protein (cupin superfamily)